MTDFTLLKIAADHAIKANGTLLADAATNNFNGLATPENVHELACSHEVASSVGNALGITLGNVVESRDALVLVVDALTAERDQLKGECEALRKDAERLRWLRTNEFDIGSYHGVQEQNATAWFKHISDESIDQCIADETQFAAENEPVSKEAGV